MDRAEFLPREKASEKFLEWRKKLNEIQNHYSKNKNFKTLFEEVKEGAAEGDVVMQDVLSYYYKTGVQGHLQEDYKKYMEWSFISGANGNEFAIDKLQFFLSYAYDEIVEHPDFGKIKYYNDIDEYNYLYIIGQKLCEQIVGQLKINQQELSKTSDIYRPYRPEYFRDYRKALDAAIPLTINIMKVPAGEN